MPLLHQHDSSSGLVTIVDWGVITGLVLLVPTGNRQSTFQDNEQCSAGVGMKVLVRYQLSFFVLSEQCRCHLQQPLLTLSLWRAINSLARSLGDWGFLWGSSGQTTPSDVTHAYHWRFHLVKRDVERGLFLPVIWWLHFDLFHICVYCREHNCGAFSVTLSFCRLSPCLFPFPSCLIFLFHSLWPKLPIHNNLFYFSFLGRSLPSPGPLVYTLCTIWIIACLLNLTANFYI